MACTAPRAKSKHTSPPGWKAEKLSAPHLADGVLELLALHAGPNPQVVVAGHIEDPPEAGLELRQSDLHRLRGVADIACAACSCRLVSIRMLMVANSSNAGYTGVLPQAAVSPGHSHVGACGHLRRGEHHS